MRANNWIGDVVMISPALKALRETYAGARIEVVARPHVRDCFTGHPWVDDVVLHDPAGQHRGLAGFLRFTGELRRRRYDLAVLFQKAFGAALMAWLARVPHRVGYDTDRRALLLTGAIHETAEDRAIHHVEYFLRVAAAAGCDVNGAGRRVYFPVDDESRGRAVRMLSSAGADRFPLLVAVATGASKKPRAWHPERFAEVARHLARDRGAGIVVVGGPGDRDAARLILEAVGAHGVDTTGRTTVRDMAALIERCSLFVGNDSGPMHLAAALDVPALAIFGPGSPAKTAPYMAEERFMALTTGYPCSPCRQDFFRECEPAPSGKPMCLETVTVDRALDAVNVLLERTAPG